jgi:hypothetical protein
MNIRGIRNGCAAECLAETLHDCLYLVRRKTQVLRAFVFAEMCVVASQTLRDGGQCESGELTITRLPMQPSDSGCPHTKQ